MSVSKANGSINIICCGDSTFEKSRKAIRTRAPSHGCWQEVYEHVLLHSSNLKHHGSVIVLPGLILDVALAGWYE